MVGCLEGKYGPFTKENWKALQQVASEFFATAIFVYCGLASCLNWSHEGDADQLIRISLTFGLGLTALAYMFGPISGCHVNPAVTIACILTGRTKCTIGLLYILAQCIGAIVGAGVLYLSQAEELTGADSNLFGLTKVNPELSIHQGLFIEAAATTILCLVVLFVTDKSWTEYKIFAPIGIGITLVALELAFVNATGGSMNPARSFGPACVVKDFGQLWVYWIGPIGGGLVAVGIYKVLTFEPKEVEAREEFTSTTPSTIEIGDGPSQVPLFVMNAENERTINVDGPGVFIVSDLEANVTNSPSKY